MLAEFSIYPLDGEHMSQDVARVVAVVAQSGLDYQLSPMSTSLEGELDQVLDVIKRCHEAVAEGGRSRVVTQITLDDHGGASHSLREAVARVEQHLGHAVQR
jgi:uncharacterized protein (TIGR00106 family)